MADGRGQRAPSSRGQGARRIESVSRAMELLELFVYADFDAGISVGEAAVKLGVGKSTISRLLATMAASGFVIADESHRYRVGPLAFEVGNRFAGAALAKSTRKILADLADRTSSTSALGTLQGTNVLYLAVAPGPDRLRVVASPGDILSLHATSMGKVLLASLDPAVTDSLLESMIVDGRLPKSGPKAIEDPAVLRRELQLARSRGYAVANEEGTRGVVSLATRIEGRDSFPLGFSIAFPVGQYRRADYPDLVRNLQESAAAASKIIAAGRGN